MQQRRVSCFCNRPVCRVCSGCAGSNVGSAASVAARFANVGFGCAGSSAGSAASVAARFAPWALCEDTGGSCRAPAIANGIYGLRPTLGCYNYSDALVLATFTRDTVGMYTLSHDIDAHEKPGTFLACVLTHQWFAHSNMGPYWHLYWSPECMRHP